MHANINNPIYALNVCQSPKFSASVRKSECRNVGWWGQILDQK